MANGRKILALIVAIFLLQLPMDVGAEPSSTSTSQIRKQRTTLGGSTYRRRKVVRRQPQRKATPSIAELKNTKVATTIDSYNRSVEVKSNTTDWKKAERKMPLAAEDKIRTGSASLARIKLADGSKVLLLQNSQAEMESLNAFEKNIRLLRGRVRAIVRRLRGGNNFKVTTPVGVASVRGTDFEVTVNDEGSDMEIQVYEGQVGVAKLGDLGKEVILNAGDRIKFGIEQELGDPIRSGSLPMQRMDMRNEIQLAEAKDAILSMAAAESRSADYQVGKTLMDVDGRRVRVEEYITRPASNEFKLVVLNERSTRFDYFTYKGTFFSDLPEDLSIALRESRGVLGGTQPDNYMTGYETVMSNTVDQITESATNGHLVKIEFDGTNYTLTDVADPTNTRTISASSLQADGLTYKIYDPIKDSFQVVTAENLAEALKISVLDSNTDTYRDLTSGDTYWKSRYNNYTSAINGVVKTAFAKKSVVNNTLAIDLDADFTDAPIKTIITQPSGSDYLHNRLVVYYDDNSYTTYDTYIIDDEGNIAASSEFSGLSSGAAYRNELEQWNYQQNVTSTEMGGRSINLVVDPRIGTISGLIP